MKIQTLSVLLLVVTANFLTPSARATEMCSDWEKNIVSDMQIKETDLTLKTSISALERLEALSKEPTTELSGFAEANSMKFVKGWLLKKSALEALERTTDATKAPELQRFCQFLASEAYYYD